MALSSQTLTYIYHASHHISNPSIYLSYMALYHIQGKTIDMAVIKQHVIGNIKHIIQQSTFILILKVKPYACPCECITYFTYLTTPQHLCINLFSVLETKHPKLSRDTKISSIGVVKTIKYTAKVRARKS